MVSREEAIGILHEEHSGNEFYFAEYDDYPGGVDGNYQTALLMAIEALSTERPKGRWVVVCDGVLKCSECGNETPYDENFCYNCGADMRGEEE